MPECLQLHWKRLQQVFTCEICKIFKNTYFYKTPPVAVSDFCDY